MSCPATPISDSWPTPADAGPWFTTTSCRRCTAARLRRGRSGRFASWACPDHLEVLTGVESSGDAGQPRLILALMVQDPKANERAQRAERLAEREHELAEKEAERSAKVSAAESDRDGFNIENHRRAAVLHDDARRLHEEAAKLQDQHADENRKGKTPKPL